MNHSADTYMELTLNRNVLKYAVQRAMFNEDGTIADVRRSVLVTIEGTGAMLLSGTAFDATLPKFTELATLGYVVEVLDGRCLSSRSESKQSLGAYTVAASPIHSCATCGGADSLLCPCGAPASLF